MDWVVTQLAGCLQSMPRVPGGSPATHELNRVVYSCNLTVGLWSGLGGCPRLQSKFEATLDQSTNAVLLPTPISTVNTAARPDGNSGLLYSAQWYLRPQSCTWHYTSAWEACSQRGILMPPPQPWECPFLSTFFIFTDSLIAYFPGVQCAISIFEDDPKHTLHHKQLLLPHSSHPPSHQEGDCKRPGR